MRKVRVFEYRSEDQKGCIKVPLPELATFHQFGCDFVEFENGVGTYTTAIVELSDGTVRNISVDMIQFLD